jgi:hypothetical protein
MAWWISRSSAYAGPGFDWVDADSVAEQRGLSGSGLSLSRPLGIENVPKIGRYRQPFETPPVADVLLVSSAVVVNDRFKNLVEEFEPDIHLFAPIELQYNDGRPIDGNFYFFNCNFDIDCILTANDPAWFRNVNNKIISNIKHIRSGTSIDVNLSKPAIYGRHLWTGGPLGWNQLFVSDIFYKAMRDSDITEFETRKHCEEIDQPWLAEANMGPWMEKWRNYVANDRNIEMGYL